MSIDDLYNNFKIVEQEVKGTAKSNSISQNMAFVSYPSPNSTNEVHTAYGVSTASTQSSTASTQVGTASTQTSIANLSDAIVYAFLANQSNGVDFDWSYMAKDEVLTNMALMAFLDSEVYNDKTCSKSCLKSFETLKTQLDDLRIEFHKSEFNLATYKRGFTSVEEQRMRKGMGFVSYNVVPPPPTGLFSPLKLDLSNSGLEEFQQPEFEGYGPKTSKSVSKDIPNEVKESPDTPLVKELVSDDKLEKKTVFLLLLRWNLLDLNNKKN
nr:hypothetical protein [Tanacetum cinerariifolium]